MAKARVDLKSFTRDLKLFERKVRVEMSKTRIKKVLQKEILTSISQGKSPVSGHGRFEKYSDSYKKQIRKGRYRGKGVRPVNLKLSGKMLRSIFIRIRSNAANLIFNVGFKRKIADYHNDGTDKLPIRRMLPTEDGEVFSKPIMKKIKVIYEKAIAKVAKRER